MNERIIGIIGGSGLYEIDVLKNANWVEVHTPWGDPSDKILNGFINRIQFYFLPRHGRNHIYTPSSVPYQANIYALKKLGVTDIISISACGSFKEELEPGHFVIVDQFIDRTTNREKTFFGSGCVCHVSMAYPICKRLSAMVEAACEDAGVIFHKGGTYLAMEGPQFSTLAESTLYQENWGCDIIGMTNMPEAKLAREAEICYSTVAMVTDYDCWHPQHGEIDINKVLETLRNNSKMAQEFIKALPKFIEPIREVCPHGCDRVLDFAIITPPKARCQKQLEKLKAIMQRISG